MVLYEPSDGLCWLDDLLYPMDLLDVYQYEVNIVCKHMGLRKHVVTAPSRSPRVVLYCSPLSLIAYMAFLYHLIYNLLHQSEDVVSIMHLIGSTNKLVEEYLQ